MLTNVMMFKTFNSIGGKKAPKNIAIHINVNKLLCASHRVLLIWATIKRH